MTQGKRKPPEDDVAREIVDAAFKVHTNRGDVVAPGSTGRTGRGRDDRRGSRGRWPRSRLDAFTAEKTISDEVAQRVVNPDTGDHLQLLMRTSVGRLLYKHDDRGAQGAVLGEANLAVRPQPVSIEALNLGQRT